MKYFDRFPIVAYSNTVVKNILTRVNFTQQTKSDIYSTFDFVLSDGQSRPDLLSSNYYNDPNYDWLIYMQNSIIDPYHDYYKSEDDLLKMILAKYGTIQSANEFIMYYRNDWSADESEISPAIYDSLSANIKKYYKPRISLANKIIGYTRLQEDWIKSTNRIVELTMTPAAISQLSIGGVLAQASSEARGTICQIDTVNNVVMVQHITGNFIVSSSVVSINNGPIDATGKYLWKLIPDEEVTFWSPVNAYNHEAEENALKKYVSIVKSSYLADIDRLFIQQIST